MGMVPVSLASIKKGVNKDLGTSNGLTDLFIKECSNRITCKDPEKWYMQMDRKQKANGIKTR